MDVTPSDSWVDRHNEIVSRMLIKDPWNDPLVKKVGLYEMYIIDSLCETMELSAEESPDVKLGCINPKYVKFHKLISEFLDDPSCAKFKAVLSYVETLLGRKLNIVNWRACPGLPNGPDIRALDTPDECMSWVKRLIKA